MAISATYVSSTEFTVDGDHTDDLTQGQKVQLGQGVDGETEEQVVNVSYNSGPDTTSVTIARSNLTSNLATVKIGLTIPVSLAIHGHTDEEDGGLMAAASLTPSGSNKLVGVDNAGSAFEMKTLVETPNRVTVTHGAGTVTYSGPQDIHTGASPEFAGLTLTGLTGLLQVTAGVVSAVDFETLDGDHLDIDWTPTYYTPDATPAEAADVDDLTAHLYGIDYLLGTHNHDASYAGIDGDVLDIDFTPTYYTPATDPPEASDVDDLAAHLFGIDYLLGTHNHDSAYSALGHNHDSDYIALGEATVEQAAGTAGEALSQYEVVYQKTTDSGEWWLAQNDGTDEEANARGIVIESGGIGDGSTGTVLLHGLITNGAWSWTPGAVLYLSDIAGGMTETEPISPNKIVQVGQAITATTVLFAPGSSAGGAGGAINWISSGWALSTSYSEDDALEHNGSAYICLADHTSSATDEPGVGAYWEPYWDLMVAKGDTGAVWDWRGAWADSTSYSIDDGVENDGNLYICIYAHTSSSGDEPGIGPYWEPYWDLLVSGGGAHAANHLDGGSDEIAGEDLAVAHTPSNYTPTDGTLGGQLAGIDTALGSVGGGAGGAPPDWCPPNIRWKDGDEMTVVAGRYFKGGYRWESQYQDITGLASYWDIAADMDIDIDAIFASGSSPGTLGGGVIGSCPYGAYLLGNTVNDVIVLPMFYIGAVDYNSTNPGKTTITFDSETDSRDNNLSSDSITDWANYSMRVYVNNAHLTYIANRIRLTLKAHSSAAAYIDNVAIVERLSNTQDGVTTPTEVLFSGGSGCTITGGSTAVSDWTDFVIDPDKDYLVVVDFGASSSSVQYVGGGTTYQKAAANTYNTAAMGTPDNTASNTFVLDLIETKLDFQDFIVNDDDFNTYRLLKISNGELCTIEDSEDDAGGDSLIIDGDEVGSGALLAAGDWLQVLPPTGIDFCYLGPIQIDYEGNLSEFMKDRWIMQFAHAKRVPANAATSVAETLIKLCLPPTARRVSGNLWVDARNANASRVKAELHRDVSSTLPIMKAEAVFGDADDADRTLVAPFANYLFWEPNVVANVFLYQLANDGTQYAAITAEIWVSAFEE